LQHSSSLGYGIIAASSSQGKSLSPPTQSSCIEDKIGKDYIIIFQISFSNFEMFIASQIKSKKNTGKQQSSFKKHFQKDDSHPDDAKSGEESSHSDDDF
jgi:hypothetical protein